MPRRLKPSSPRTARRAPRPSPASASPQPTRSENRGTQDDDPTRLRLLDAAGEVFARRGFRDATIREIARLAGANIAAAHYHFGNKAGLYRALFHHAAQAADQPHLSRNLPSDPRQRLAVLVSTLLHRMLDDGKPAWHGVLVAREMAQPTFMLDELVAAMIHPMWNAFRACVRELAGPGLSPRQLDALTANVIGQITLHRHGRAVLDRVAPSLRPTRTLLAEQADLITRFSLAALDAFASSRKA